MRVFDVVVHFVHGKGTIEHVFPKVHYVTRDGAAIVLEVKKYPALGGDTERTHVATVPFNNMMWYETREL